MTNRPASTKGKFQLFINKSAWKCSNGILGRGGINIKLTIPTILRTLSGCRHCASCFTHTISINLFPSFLLERSHYHPHFIDEETEAQRGKVTCQASDFRAQTFSCCKKQRPSLPRGLPRAAGAESSLASHCGSSSHPPSGLTLSCPSHTYQ